MAWRNPEWSIQHAAQAAGVGAVDIVDLANGSVPTQAGDVEALRDGRLGPTVEFEGANNRIWFDRGNGGDTTPFDSISHLWLPPGHNFANVTVLNDSFATVMASTAVTPGVSVLLPLDAPNTLDQVLLVGGSISGAGNGKLSELYFTTPLTTVRGPENRWGNDIEFNSLTFAKESGLSTRLQTGPNLRTFEYNYRLVRAPDQVTLDAVVAMGDTRPFVHSPAYDDEAPVWVTLERGVRSGDDTNLPSVYDTLQQRYQLALREQLA